MKFKLNDYVRVKPGVKLEETDELVEGWVGRIDEVPTDPADPAYLLELDALSLESYPPKYLTSLLVEQEPAIAYYFLESELEPAKRRDTEAQLHAAQGRIFNHVMGEEEEPVLDETTLNNWQDAFEQSPHFQTLTLEQQENAHADIELFADWAFNYEDAQPKAWDVRIVRTICTEVIPRKMTAPIESFKNMGPIFEQFFTFLADRNLLKNADALRREMKKIAPTMVKNAADSSNWGIAKGMMMGAMNSGVDLSDEAAISQFLSSKQAKFQLPTNFNLPLPARPATPNPHKDIGRNSLVQVRYPDGSVKKDKFKRFQADLLANRCELIGKA